MKKTHLIFSLIIISLFAGQAIFAQTIKGQLLKSTNKPLAYTEIELVPIDSDTIVVDSRLIGISNGQGKFSFSNIPDGVYTLSINFDDKPTDLSPYPTYFYPNTYKRAEAEIFEVKKGNINRTISFRLPPALIKRKITGKVILPNNKPIEGAYIFIVDVYFDRFYSFGRIKSGKLGEFVINAFESRKYQIGAILFEKSKDVRIPDFLGKPLAGNESKIFTLDANTKPFEIILGEEEEEPVEIKNKYIG